MKLPTHGASYVWEFEKDGEDVRVRVEGQITVTRIGQVLSCALDGYGLGYMPEDLASPYLATGALVRVLSDWTPPWSGYHLYYPSRRQPSLAFSIVMDALRYRA